MINNVRQAIPIAIKTINNSLQDDNVVDIDAVNQNRHYILKTKKGMRYYLLFKRKFFMSFGKIFSFKGCGDSVNDEYMDFAKRMEADTFVFVYPEGNVYIAPVQESYDFAMKNDTKRITKSGETTCSFPVKLLRRWKS